MTVKVTEADREAAADAVKAYRDQKNGNWQQRIRDGLCDDGEMVQAFARHAQQAREQALEDAAVAMENLCFFTDIEELRKMTKQDLSVRTCHKGAEAIRALKETKP